MVLVHDVKLELELVKNIVKQLRSSQMLTETNGSVLLFKLVQMHEISSQIHGFYIVSYTACMINNIS